MLTHLRRSAVAAVMFFVLCGLVYPLVGTGVSQLLFSHQANGSLTADGSTLIGQQWSGPMWFQGRPSATVNAAGNPSPDNAMFSGASNLGPRSAVLEHEIAQRVGALQREGISRTVDLVTASGSGLDPDISPADAYAQVASVAKARHLSDSVVHALVARNVVGQQFGFLGMPYVDVMTLNMQLAKLS